MSFFSDIWNSITGVFQSALEALHTVLEPTFGDVAWGWAIIALTLIIRVLLLPLASKQARSMRAMQELQPQIKKIQERHKVDKSLMKKDPELYRKKKAEQNEKLMALYQEEGVNPASSCLPLLLQAPVFIALFSVLRGFEELRNAPFYFITSDIGADAAGSGLGALVQEAGWPGWLMIAAMVVSMFVTQRQTMARTTVEGPQAQQQKIMLYVLPVFLAFISRSLPLGVILYWVTTNVWQGVQQWVIFREGGVVDKAAAKTSSPAAEDASTSGSSDKDGKKKAAPGSNGAKGAGSSKASNGSNGSNGARGGSGAKGKNGAKGSRGSSSSSGSHLPKRRSS